MYYLARRFDRAIGVLQRILEMEPHYPGAKFRLGCAYEQTGRLDEAITEFQNLVAEAKDRRRPQAWLAHAYALAGKARAAKDIARELASGHPALASSIALVYAGLGEVEPAIQWFQKSYEQRGPFFIPILVDPACDKLRSEPAFVRLYSLCRSPFEGAITR